MPSSGQWRRRKSTKARSTVRSHSLTGLASSLIVWATTSATKGRAVSVASVAISCAIAISELSMSASIETLCQPVTTPRRTLGPEVGSDVDGHAVGVEHREAADAVVRKVLWGSERHPSVLRLRVDAVDSVDGADIEIKAVRS